jgi:hypothetical protein
MKTNLNEELYSQAKEYSESKNKSAEEIQDEHDGRWAGAAVLIAILVAVVVLVWSLNAIFSL